MSRIAVLLLLCVVAGPALTQERDRFRVLKTRWRKLDAAGGFSSQRAERLRILREMARLGDRQSVQFLMYVAREPRFESLRGSVLRLIADHAKESPDVDFLFREHMGADDPHRGLARKFLLDRAVRNRDDVWLTALFSMGKLEDHFLALRALGQIGSPTTLKFAESLVRDRSWKPKEGTVVNCGTIAASLKDAEGSKAAQLLLLLLKDERFQDADTLAVRDATRLWSRGDLRDYVDMTALAAADPSERANAADFMGKAGIEGARAPLLHLACSANEPPLVRASAAAALGGLSLARGDLANRLGRLLDDHDPTVRLAAIDGLSRLPVRQAAELLVGMARGRHRDEVRLALARLSGEPPRTNWQAWLDTRCKLPSGT